MFSEYGREQWLQRIKLSTVNQISYLIDTLRHPAYALARLRNASLHADILAMCDAELRLREHVQASIADIVPEPDLNLTRTTRE